MLLKHRYDIKCISKTGLAVPIKFTVPSIGLKMKTKLAKLLDFRSERQSAINNVEGGVFF